jgi:rhodanese-related sulfurtransferase
MRRSTLIAIALLAAMTAGAQMKVQQTTPHGSSTQLLQPQQPAAPGTWESARRIPREAAIQLVKSGKAVFVDVRSFETYSKGHINGAISIPRSQMISRFREIPPGKLIITYCACVREHTAALAVVELAQHGVNSAAALAGGWTEWTAARLPTKTGAN